MSTKNDSDRAPQVPDHRLVGEHAERAENKTPTNLADSSRVGQTKEGVELQRLVDFLKRQAAHQEWLGARRSKQGQRLYSYRMKKAAEYHRWASLVVELCAAPLTQSDSNGGEGCKHDRIDEHDGLLTCLSCGRSVETDNPEPE